MRNVWRVPTVEAVQVWLAEAGFIDAQVVSVERTTARMSNARRTGCASNHSLRRWIRTTRCARSRAIPAPVRAVLMARKR